MNYDAFLLFLQEHDSHLQNMSSLEVINEWGLQQAIDFQDVSELLHIINVIKQHPNILKEK